MPRKPQPVVEGGKRLGTLAVIPEQFRRSALLPEGSLPGYRLRRVILRDHVRLGTMSVLEVCQDLFKLLCRVRVPAKPRVLDVFTHEALDLASALVGLKQRLAKHGSGDVGQVLVLGDGADLIPGESAEIKTFLER